MATAGYSGTPLIQKLGIKPQWSILLINTPPDYFDLLQTDLTNQLARKNDTVDFIHLFVKNNRDFETEMKKIKALIKNNTSITIWISWYKKSAKIPTDVTEDIIRNYA